MTAGGGFKFGESPSSFPVSLVYDLQNCVKEAAPEPDGSNAVCFGCF